MKDYIRLRDVPLLVLVVVVWVWVLTVIFTHL